MLDDLLKHNFLAYLGNFRRYLRGIRRPGDLSLCQRLKIRSKLKLYNILQLIDDGLIIVFQWYLVDVVNVCKLILASDDPEICVGEILTSFPTLG